VPFEEYVRTALIDLSSSEGKCTLGVTVEMTRRPAV
jgi:hypothetical protein